MMFACSDSGQGDMQRDIEEQHLDGLVVASCSPKLHVVTFRGVAKRAGLNPYEYTQVNVREQASWVQSDDQQATTNKVINLVKAGIARTRLSEPLEPIVVETTQKTLVVGGGVAGLRAAIGLADIGLGVFLVEREPELGGWVGRFDAMYPTGKNGRELIASLIEQVRARPSINVFTEAELVSKSGSFGNYTGRHPARRAGRRDDHGRGRLDRRRDRLRHLPAGGRRVRLRDRRRRDPARVQGADRSVVGPAAVPRQARPDGRLRVLRRQPPGRRPGRQRLLLALLLRRDRRRLGPARVA